MIFSTFSWMRSSETVSQQLNALSSRLLERITTGLWWDWALISVDIQVFADWLSSYAVRFLEKNFSGFLSRTQSQKKNHSSRISKTFARNKFCWKICILEEWKRSTAKKHKLEYIFSKNKCSLMFERASKWPQMTQNNIFIVFIPYFRNVEVFRELELWIIEWTIE